MHGTLRPICRDPEAYRPGCPLRIDFDSFKGGNLLHIAEEGYNTVRDFVFTLAKQEFLKSYRRPRNFFSGFTALCPMLQPSRTTGVSEVMYGDLAGARVWFHEHAPVS